MPSTAQNTSLNYYPFGSAIDSRAFACGGYRYGIGGHEKIDEVAGVTGAHVDMGDRWLDTRIGRTPKPDKKAEDYPYLSPYSYAANNPIIFIYPDGEKIVLAGTAAQQKAMLTQLQTLTNDKLTFDPKTGVVKITKLGGENLGKTLTAGTQLVQRLNSKQAGAKTVTIQSGSKWTEPDVNPTAATDGTGSDAIVNFAPTHLPNLPVEDPKTGNLIQEKSNATTNFGHELIHAERSMRGEAIPYGDYGTQTYKDATGTTVTDPVRKEEAATVGVGYNKKKDITENDLRKEQGLKKRTKY
jgi:hypothetical protein